MLKRLTIFVTSCFYLLIIGCSKGETPTPQPPNPPPGGGNTFTISNLAYSPSVIPILPNATTFTINGTINFQYAGGGIASLRMTSSAGFDTTILIQGGAGQTSGTVNGSFILTRPSAPAQFSFDIWLIDMKGVASNKLSGSVSIIIDDRGLNWIKVGEPNIPCRFNEIKWYNNQFIGVGTAGVVAYSKDGITWSWREATPTHLNLKSITWTGSQYVVVGEKGTILTSPDGINWQDHSMEDDFNYSLNAVTWSGSLLVAVGENSVPVGRTDILTSPDGIHWTRNDFSINRSELRAISWTGNQFVAAGIGRTPDNAYAMIFTSPDGLNWTDRSLPDYHTPLYDILWSGNKIIAIGAGITVSSLNGIAWDVAEYSNTVGIGSFTFSGNTYVAVGDGIYTSADAIHWTQVYTGSHLYYLNTVAWSGMNYVAAGEEYYSVMVSPF